ncbi:tRNA cyclic N6-threonylcarbamoyladenosine(37) synthase TcdA [Ralstonia sp. CHL-2022]|uniref:tRNA cyclic N6-threonylcarbamoyladenosine(37) synthase TcdA n=1 Tax=Ralstonia mojiangensis TaxID=2953895 RepID=A0ABT2L4X5_9RALS|nr:tRNA cyclic N6-threonylcarbamoyladenosine(37) synthase TcdA [Ralstonia mojiangensis]MCT7297431.1 tRNA cyclic N6-threonylcarbamoyladenosine(37) synthase TcdA [Ralstonia mojiangensis]MCT7309992.1 tRNA cyclic N6-threonylcarbamoyladenosine(37) synthase TcdA [Ralstonia mojiangensis]
MSQVAISAPAHPPILDDEYARRFGGVARLYGPQALQRFAAAHVCVIGIGGVGSWVAEAVARCGVGKFTLIDLDHIAVSNTNRQIHALGDAYGMAKVDAMAERILQINPRAEISRIDDFVTIENVEALLGHPFDYVIDAIDAVKVKTAIIAFCKRTGKRVVTCGAAGGQLDPTRIRVTDLSRTIQDPLLAKVRGNLRRQHGFSKNPKSRFGIDAVFSDEPLRYPEAEQQACAVELPVESSHAGIDDLAAAGDIAVVNAPPAPQPAQGPQGLACAGFGSSVCVTAVFGMVAASTALRAIADV